MQVLSGSRKVANPRMSFQFSLQRNENINNTLGGLHFLLEGVMIEFVSHVMVLLLLLLRQQRSGGR